VAGVLDAWGRPKAWVVLKPGEIATEDEIRDYCKKNMAPFKVPTLVEFRDALPKTTVGKVLRRELVREHVEKTAVSK
jgi:long-chain acyl-CoA synthetase